MSISTNLEKPQWGVWISFGHYGLRPQDELKIRRPLNASASRLVDANSALAIVLFDRIQALEAKLDAAIGKVTP